MAEATKRANTVKNQQDIFADLEATLDQVAESNPRIDTSPADGTKATSDLSALLEVSLAVNSSLVLDDVLEIVMARAIDLMKAERGLIMLLDDDNKLRVRTAYKLSQEEMSEEEVRISNSVVDEVASTGRSVYMSDALSDERYAKQRSIMELHLRSIMCVPLKDKDRVIGVIYLDNSNQASMFLKSDLYLFELYAQMAANALRNARIYDSLLSLKRYNESVIQNSPAGIVVIDSQLRIATINPVALEIFDINQESVEVTGRSENPTDFLDLLPEDERPRWRAMINASLATRQEFAEPRHFHSTGYVEKVLSLKICPISALPSGDDGLVMAIEDITDKVVMEKYVILSEKLAAKGEMAASIAHELNNYLAIASTNAELLNMNVEREKYDKAQFNARTVVENVFKIKRFVDSLMDFSKPDPEYISYDIKHLIEDLLFSLRVQPRFKRTHFTIDLGPDLPNIEMDVGQIQQVLMNLLNNAADAIEERASAEEEAGDTGFKREIGITARYDETAHNLTIEVVDNGTGMSEEVRQKIFNMHYTTKKGGHGLGLSNCEKIISNHQGGVSVSSTPGQGTTFRVTLPRYHAAQKKWK